MSTSPFEILQAHFYKDANISPHELAQSVLPSLPICPTHNTAQVRPLITSEGIIVREVIGKEVVICHGTANAARTLMIERLGLLSKMVAITDVDERAKIHAYAEAESRLSGVTPPLPLHSEDQQEQPVSVEDTQSFTPVFELEAPAKQTPQFSAVVDDIENTYPDLFRKEPALV